MRSAVGGLLAGVLLLSGCGSDRVPPVTSGEKPGDALTPRALAAGMLRHIDQDRVTRIGGYSGDGEVVASVDTSLESVESIVVIVVPSDSPQAVRRCGQDSGYVEVECRTDAGLLELTRRGPSADSRLPVLSGRYYSNQRGGLLIQVWGRADTTATHLVRSLMADPLIGVNTSPELTDAGLSLTDFKKDEFSSEISVG